MTACGLVAALLAGVLVPAPVPAGQTPTNWFGTWTLNVAKSASGSEPPRYKRATLRVESFQDGVTMIDEMVRSRGGLRHLEWTGKFDGLDYPVEGVEAALTNAYRRLDDRTLEIIQKLDGVVVATGRLTLSPDGKTLTRATSDGTGSTTTIYEKP